MLVQEELYRCFVEKQRAVQRLRIESQQDYAALVEMRRERRRIARDLRWWAKRIEDNEEQLRRRKRRARRVENRLAIQLIDTGPKEEAEESRGTTTRDEESEPVTPIDPLPSAARSNSSSTVDPPVTSRTSYTPALPPISEGAITVHFD